MFLINAVLAQKVEHILGKDEVGSSTLLDSSNRIGICGIYNPAYMLPWLSR